MNEKNGQTLSPVIFEGFYQSSLTNTVENIFALIKQHIPTGTHRNFLLWILDKDNPHRDNYLQLTGILKMAELNAYFLQNLNDQTLSEKLIPYLSALNAYFFNEVISDNLAIGLARQQPTDLTWQKRRDILFRFNTIMQNKLSGDIKPSRLMLSEALSESLKRISLFEQSLAPEEIRQLVMAYQNQHPEISLEHLEYDLLPYLILNIESLLTIIKMAENHPLSALLTQKFIDRYSAMNELLKLNGDINLENLVTIGEKTILVTPMLLFLTIALDKISPSLYLQEIIDNDVLINTLDTAACIIRLQNDIGTELLNLSESNINTLKNQFLLLHKKTVKINSTSSFFSFLETCAEETQFESLLSRIRKDIKYNEFNICLENLKHTTNSENILESFFTNILYFSKLYKKKEIDLDENLNAINNFLHENRLSHLIFGMVKFHEKLYKNQFEHSHGDYATKS